MGTAEKIKVKEDGAGNYMYAQGTGIYLQMLAAGRAKRLSTIDLPNKMLLLNRESFQLHNRFYYGFNYTLLQVASKCDTLRITCPEGTFDVPIKEILLRGKKLEGEHGMETQIFFLVEDMKLHPAKELLV